MTSGAPVELLRAFDFYTIYPENHGALCGAQRLGPEYCGIAEDHGYHQDLCSYARIDLGHALSGKTPVGKLPQPDLLFASNNICQTVLYWYRVLAHRLKVPLLLFDTPYNFKNIRDEDIHYMVDQLKEMIPVLEKAIAFKLPKIAPVAPKPGFRTARKPDCPVDQILGFAKIGRGQAPTSKVGQIRKAIALGWDEVGAQTGLAAILADLGEKEKARVALERLCPPAGPAFSEER